MAASAYINSAEKSSVGGPRVRTEAMPASATSRELCSGMRSDVRDVDGRSGGAVSVNTDSTTMLPVPPRIGQAGLSLPNPAEGLDASMQ